MISTLQAKLELVYGLSSMVSLMPNSALQRTELIKQPSAHDQSGFISIYNDGCDQHRGMTFAV